MKAREIVETYFGNKKLIKSEKERENELLENIGSTINRKLLQQHKSLKKKDTTINSESTTKKIDEVSKVLSEHIIKGNDIKLLIALDDEEENDESQKLLEDIKKASLEVRNHLKKLGTDDKRLLLEKYTIKEDNNDT